MRCPEPVESCVVPGGQSPLFHLSVDRVPRWSVIDRTGHVHVQTGSLGVAVTVARRVLIEQGEAWVRASDDTVAHLDPSRVATDTPSCPWIRSLAASLEASP